MPCCHYLWPCVSEQWPPVSHLLHTSSKLSFNDNIRDIRIICDVPDVPRFSYLSVQTLAPLLAEILHRFELRSCLLFLFHVCLELHDEQHVALGNQSSCHIPARLPITRQVLIASHIVTGTYGAGFLID